MNQVVKLALQELDVTFTHELGEVFEVKNGGHLLNVEITKRHVTIDVDPDTGVINSKVLYGLETAPRSRWNWDGWTEQHIHESRVNAKIARRDNK